MSLYISQVLVLIFLSIFKVFHWLITFFTSLIFLSISIILKIKSGFFDFLKLKTYIISLGLAFISFYLLVSINLYFCSDLTLMLYPAFLQILGIIILILILIPFLSKMYPIGNAIDKIFKIFRPTSPAGLILLCIIILPICFMACIFFFTQFGKIIIVAVIYGCFLGVFLYFLTKEIEKRDLMYAAVLEEKVKAEQLKTQLIANVSHDIKTHLTSIISYSELLGQEGLEQDKIMQYSEIIGRKSNRLKKLIDDLIDASKVGTGNVTVSPNRIDLCEILDQILGEYDSQFSEKNLEIVVSKELSNMYTVTDGNHLARVFENLFSNIYKYALPSSRVYITLKTLGDCYELSFKNISESPLNMTPKELTQQFITGDKSRTNGSSGLGLYIAQNLSSVIKVDFKLKISADLFECFLRFTPN